MKLKRSKRNILHSSLFILIAILVIIIHIAQISLADFDGSLQRENRIDLISDYSVDTPLDLNSTFSVALDSGDDEQEEDEEKEGSGRESRDFGWMKKREKNKGKNQGVKKKNQKKQKQKKEPDEKVECGGTLRGESGRLRYEKNGQDNGLTFNYLGLPTLTPHSCIWIIKLWSSSKPRKDSSIAVTVEKWRLSPGSTLSFYPEDQLQSESPRPIAFTNTNHSKANDAGVFRLQGQSFVVVLSSNLETEAETGLSVHLRWFSEVVEEDADGRKKPQTPNITTTTNYVTSYTDKAWVYWSSREFRPRQKSTWVLNAGDYQYSGSRSMINSRRSSLWPYLENSEILLTMNMTVEIDTEAKFRGEVLPFNLCERASFHMYEILNGGKLRRVARHCRGILKLSVPHLTNQILVFITTNSLGISESPFRFVELNWEIEREAEERNEIVEITTETPVETTTTTTPKPPAWIRRCPSRESIAPCSCFNSAGHALVRVECFGSAVTQESITNFFTKIRKINKLDPDQWILLEKFRIQRTTRLTSLDLAPFFYMDAKLLEISINEKFRQFNLPATNSTKNNAKLEQTPLIKVSRLRIVENPCLTDSGIGQTLRYFQPLILKELVLASNQLTGESEPEPSKPSKMSPIYKHKSKYKLKYKSKSEQVGVKDVDEVGFVRPKNPEFLPGLSLFTELTGIYLNFNRIRTLKRDQFRHNTKLLFLGLPGNRLETIEPEAFRFATEETPNYMKKPSYPLLHIDLSRNLLSGANGSFPIESGLDSIERPVFLDLDDNKFEYLPQEVFERFLRIPKKGHKNKLSINYNPLMCDDPRADWFKAARASLIDTVLNSQCKDDIGKTLFSSLPKSA